MKKKYQFFISSTYADLIDERLEIIQTILRTENIPLVMEAFPAADKKQMDLIKEIIDQSDFYIVLVGGRYGSIDPESGKSYTELEYDYAVSRGIPILAFLKTDDSITKNQMDTEQEKQEKLEAFKNKLKEKLLKFWNNKHELAAAVSQAIIHALKDNPPGGLIKYDEMPEILELTQKNEFEKKYIEEITNNIKELENFEFCGEKGHASINKMLENFKKCFNDIEFFFTYYNEHFQNFLKNIIPTTVNYRLRPELTYFQNDYLYNFKSSVKNNKIPVFVPSSLMNPDSDLIMELSFIISFYGLNNREELYEILTREKYPARFILDLLDFLSYKYINDSNNWDYLKKLLKEYGQYHRSTDLNLQEKIFSNDKNNKIFYCGFDKKLDNFFNTSYELYKKLYEEKLPEEEKIGLIYKLRNNYTKDMQSLLFAYSISFLGRKWELQSEKSNVTKEEYNLITRYQLLNKLDKNFLHVQYFYPRIAYDSYY